MSTTVEESAVEEVMGRIAADMGGALGVLLTALGTRSGLWGALAGAGPLTVDEVAARVTVARPLVREWLASQAAGGYLTYDPATRTFTLPDAVAAAVYYGPGGQIVDAGATMFSSMGAGFAEFARAFGSGQGFGWHQRTIEHWHGQDAFTRATLPDEFITAAVGALPDVAAALVAGGSVADVGCGYGAPTLVIAGQYPAARVLGIDYHDASIAHCRALAAQAGLANARFEVMAATDLPGTGYDLITFFDSLHDLGDPLGALRQARAALGQTGSVLLFEPAAGDDIAANLNPNGRMFYAVSTLICTPNAVAQQGPASGEPLGAQAGEARLRELAAQAGFSRVTRLDIPAPMNMVLDLRP